MTTVDKQMYYRLIALWAVCEGVLGGLLHGIQIPITGITVGSAAVIIICLIGYYVPQKGAIIRATIIVAIFKLMLSPQSPLPAYFAVFFQGMLGELFFFTKKYYKISCVIFAAIALVESAVQRVLVVTLLYGTTFWKAVNDFINGLTHQQTVTNYSVYITVGYIFIHFITGLFIGRTAARIPANIIKWRAKSLYYLPAYTEAEAQQISDTYPKRKARKKIIRNSFFVIWIALLLLYLQSTLHIGAPLLSSDDTLHILIRSILILLTWYFLVSPLLYMLLKKWLIKQKEKSSSTVNEILLLIPSTQLLVERSWLHAGAKKGMKRMKIFMKTILVNLFDDKYDAA